jgi:hypothetical protein
MNWSYFIADEQEKCTRRCFKRYLICVYYLFVNITRFDLYSVILFCLFLRGKSGKIHRENPFFLSARAQCEFCWNTHAYLLPKQWPFEYFVAEKYQTLEEYFSQLCTCFAWGATDSDKVSFYLRSSTRGATELHLLDAHPTAYWFYCCFVKSAHLYKEDW